MITRKSFLTSVLQLTGLASVAAAIDVSVYKGPGEKEVIDAIAVGLRALPDWSSHDSIVESMVAFTKQTQPQVCPSVVFMTEADFQTLQGWPSEDLRHPGMRVAIRHSYAEFHQKYPAGIMGMRTIYPAPCSAFA